MANVTLKELIAEGLSNRFWLARQREESEINIYIFEGEIRRTFYEWAHGLPPHENLPKEGRQITAWLESQKLDYEIARCGGFQGRKSHWAIFVKVPRLSRNAYLEQFSAKFHSAMQGAEEPVAVYICPARQVNRAWWEGLFGLQFFEEALPDEGVWVCEFLREEGYTYEIAACGGFQGRESNYGIFVHPRQFACAGAVG